MSQDMDLRDVILNHLPATVETLVKKLKVSEGLVRGALNDLRKQGFAEEKGGKWSALVPE